MAVLLRIGLLAACRRQAVGRVAICICRYFDRLGGSLVDLATPGLLGRPGRADLSVSTPNM